MVRPQSIQAAGGQVLDISGDGLEALERATDALHARKDDIKPKAVFRFCPDPREIGFRFVGGAFRGLPLWESLLKTRLPIPPYRGVPKVFPQDAVKYMQAPFGSGAPVQCFYQCAFTRFWQAGFQNRETHFSS